MKLYVNGESNKILAQYTTENNAGYCFRTSQSLITLKEGNNIRIHAQTPTWLANYFNKKGNKIMEKIIEHSIIKWNIEIRIILYEKI